jgi:hypothetical protein
MRKGLLSARAKPTSLKARTARRADSVGTSGTIQRKLRVSAGSPLAIGSGSAPARGKKRRSKEVA